MKNRCIINLQEHNLLQETIYESKPDNNKQTYDETTEEFDNLRHSLWHFLRQISFQLRTWSWLKQTILVYALVQVSSLKTPQTVTHISTIVSFDNALSLFSILFEVHTLSQTKILSELFSHPFAILCFFALLFFILIACPIITGGITAPKRHHHGSTMLGKHKLREMS